MLEVSIFTIILIDFSPYLKEYDGRLSFATDAWTSPNHCAFVAWTVHLEYEGEMLSFLLDIVELPEVCQTDTRMYNY